MKFGILKYFRFRLSEYSSKINIYKGTEGVKFIHYIILFKSFYKKFFFYNLVKKKNFKRKFSSKKIIINSKCHK